MYFSRAESTASQVAVMFLKVKEDPPGIPAHDMESQDALQTPLRFSVRAGE